MDAGGEIYTPKCTHPHVVSREYDETRVPVALN